MPRTYSAAYLVASPSSRRAWIEIITTNKGIALIGSPSSRRAWIEIIPRPEVLSLKRVALLAEGVDRNTWLLLGLVALYCRPPRGGRG